MLESILIKNFAIIDNLEISFNTGMAVLTGETGAGKSIIIDAIGQLIGQRTQISLIKEGCDSAFIEGIFDIKHRDTLKELLEEYDIDYDDKLVVSKKFDRDGKTTIKLNYRRVSSTILKKILPVFIDIHSQFDTQSLFEQKNHRAILDGYLDKDIESLLIEYQTAYKQYLDLKKIYKTKLEEEYSDEQLDYYQAQLASIKEIDIDNFNEEELIKTKNQLQDYEKTNQYIQNFKNLINGNMGLNQLLNDANSQLTYLQDNELFSELVSKFNDLYYEISEISEEIQTTADNINYDYDLLTTVQDQLFKFNGLKRKYGNSLEDILEARATLEAKINNFNNREEIIKELRNKIDQLEERLKTLAYDIHKVRTRGAKDFNLEITQQLQDLYLPNVTFKVDIKETQFNQYGMDDVCFLISTNVGVTVQPIQKVASGGELSRIMLAIKTAVLKYSEIETIIFDEVDTGVSGKIAEAIGIKMHEIAKNIQVLAITHLSQVASQAEEHFLIEKTATSDRTFVSVESLDFESSIKELAKMISGKNITPESIDLARKIKRCK